MLIFATLLLVSLVCDAQYFENEPVWLSQHYTSSCWPASQVFKTPNICLCSQMCLKKLCMAISYNESTKSCVLTGATELAGNGQQRSHIFRRNETVVRKNVALMKSVIASSVYSTIGPEHVTNGNSNVDDLFHSAIGDPLPFIVIDLEQEMMIQRLRIMPRRNYFDPTRFINISIRGGTAEVPGPDFSSYTELAFFVGPPVNPATWITFDLPTPICARFVSVQRTATTGQRFLEINEVEVYGPL
ncbi:uncharacterized protein LOC108676439 [Hyalella azteca]|uniref:Uncharacterized protein LOC108676439 n=1 Tax=Hyalella azteca TaxID=294128 RepID=A0A8B7P1M9_HYAAZ|nr:uncharacterized protein LOC108676439 [Hyalella azteca]